MLMCRGLPNRFGMADLMWSASGQSRIQSQYLLAAEHLFAERFELLNLCEVALSGPCWGVCAGVLTKPGLPASFLLVLTGQALGCWVAKSLAAL